MSLLSHMDAAENTTNNIATKLHVAVLASPGLGHVIPLLELAKRLVALHDFRVTFLVITTTTESSPAQDQLLHSPNLPQNIHVINLPPVDVSQVTTSDMRILTRICEIVQESLKVLKSVFIEIGKPKALVIDIFCTQAFEICKELSIPTYTFVTGSIAFLTFSLYHPTLDHEVEGEFVDQPEPINVPGCTPIRPVDLLDQVKDRKNVEYKWFLYFCSRLPMTTGIFINSWEDLEPVALKAIEENSFYTKIPTPPVHPIGPLIREEEEASNQSDIELVAWLDKQPPDSVLLVTLGSGGTLTAQQLCELAWGLELSQQRFILVARTPSDASASASFFNVGSDANDPKAYLPEGFVERTEGRGLVVPSWAPQVAVLGHVATGGFLSHCGWNSTLESVSFGVPMIAWPLYAEQRMNATALEEEIGVAVKPVVGPGDDVVGRGEVERVVRMVMEGEEGKVMRQKVRELKEKAAKALDVNGSSYKSLASVANGWKEQALSR